VEFDAGQGAVDDETENPPLVRLVDDTALTEPIGSTVDDEFKVGLGADEEPPDEVFVPPEVLEAKDPELNGLMLELYVGGLLVLVGPTMEVEFDVGYGADEDPTEEAIVLPETLDEEEIDPELKGPTFKELRMYVPVGPTLEVELKDVGYGALDDPTGGMIMPQDTVDEEGEDPELNGPIVDELYDDEIGRLLAPVGPAECVELEVRYGTVTVVGNAVGPTLEVEFVNE
jgi:hypothetical protein